MRKGLLFLPAWLYFSSLLSAQTLEKRYSREALRIDLLYIQYQLFAVHANPFTLTGKQEFEQLFASLEAGLPDSLTAAEFVALVKPVIDKTGDEHAHLEVPVLVKKTAAVSVNKRFIATEQLSYERHGQTGYLYAGSFGSNSDSIFNRYARMLDSIFRQMQLDGVNRLIIDVSHNSGGNSALGKLIIDRFYGHPYRDYSLNWKRSDEYLNLVKSWGMMPDSIYTAAHPGDIIHIDADTTIPRDNAYRFKGKVYLLIGNGTFSSAMIFGTLVKDNKMATLIGEAPKDGHPTHFGELYGVTTPILALNLRFGVKEWIRPAGKGGENVLTPDIVIDAGSAGDRKTLIKLLP